MIIDFLSSPPAGGAVVNEENQLPFITNFQFQTPSILLPHLLHLPSVMVFEDIR
jgi:hypothetical protein